MATQRPDTEELLRRADQGDASAAGQLMGRHRARLRRMVAVRIAPEVVILRHLEQLTLREIAAVLGITEAATQSRCRRAVERLHGVLA
jgi:DNA-directed RNA polymerase specialized sigma24 family protein